MRMTSTLPFSICWRDKLEWILLAHAQPGAHQRHADLGAAKRMIWILGGE